MTGNKAICLHFPGYLQAEFVILYIAHPSPPPLCSKSKPRHETGSSDRSRLQGQEFKSVGEILGSRSRGFISLCCQHSSRAVSRELSKKEKDAIGAGWAIPCHDTLKLRPKHERKQATCFPPVSEGSPASSDVGTSGQPRHGASCPFPM